MMNLTHHQLMDPINLPHQMDMPLGCADLYKNKIPEEARNEKLDCKHKCKDKLACGHECCKRLSNFFSRVKRKREESRYMSNLPMMMTNFDQCKYAYYDMDADDTGHKNICPQIYPTMYQDQTFKVNEMFPYNSWNKELVAKKMKPFSTTSDYSQMDMFGEDFGMTLEPPMAGENLELSKISIRVVHEDDSSYDCAIEVLLHHSPIYYNETINDIKRRLVHQVQDFSYANLLNIFTSEWWLGDKPLLDDALGRDCLTKSYSSIICRSWPKSLEPPVSLIIHIMDNGSMNVVIERNQTVGHIKVFIESQFGEYNARELALIYRDVVLEDTTLIESCNFLNGDLIECRPRMRIKDNMRSFVKNVRPPTNTLNQSLRIELDKSHELVRGAEVDASNVIQVFNAATGELIPGNVEIPNHMTVMFYPFHRMKSARYRVVIEPKAFSNYNISMSFSNNDLTTFFQIQGEEHTLLCVAKKGEVATDCNICLSRTEMDYYEELKLTIAATFGFLPSDIIQLRSGIDSKYIVEEHNDVKRLKNKDRVWYVLNQDAKLRG